MGSTVEQFVERYVLDPGEHAWALDRSVTEPSGLDAAGMIAALGHPALGRLGIPLMADLMAPEGSVYYDAIFGAFHGQADIRAWLLPAMAEIEFIEFVPMAEPVVFDDGEGGTSLDEWQMVANIGDAKLPLSRGVSVRRYRDGWITWACDVYDTGAFRQEPPPDAGIAAAPLPPWPRVTWPAYDGEPSRLPDDRTSPEAVHLDPLVGELRGEAAITSWQAEVAAKRGNVAREPLGPALSDGADAVQEWVEVAVQPDGSRVPTLRGTSVRRFADGLLVSSADYFDTAPLADPDILAALAAAGSTLTAADIERHRST